MKKLSKSEVDKKLAQLNEWELSGRQIKKEFIFDNFDSAFEFMVKLAVTARKLDHHPLWSNSYNKVSISLTTHSVDGLSEKDFEFAESADLLSKQ